MRIGSNSDYLELELIGRIVKKRANDFGDAQLKATLKLQEFQGSYDQIWIYSQTLLDFVESLEELERTRSGSVKLESTSPDEFVLKIGNIDRAGHMAAEVQLQRNQYQGDGEINKDIYWKTRLSGGFEITSDQLVELLLFFKNLV
jgi:hypothetical protein